MQTSVRNCCQCAAAAAPWLAVRAVRVMLSSVEPLDCVLTYLPTVSNISAALQVERISENAGQAPFACAPNSQPAKRKGAALDTCLRARCVCMPACKWLRAWARGLTHAVRSECANQWSHHHKRCSKLNHDSAKRTLRARGCVMYNRLPVRVVQSCLYLLSKCIRLRHVCVAALRSP